MQDSFSLPQHLVGTLAFALSFSVTAVSALGCSHREPEPQHARSREGERERTPPRAAPVRTEVNPVARTEDNPVARTEEQPAMTAMDQSNDPQDLEITRRIRASVVVDPALSVSARNCTIITRGGVVTLRGNVTESERDRIAVHVQSVPGVLHVDDLLAVP